MRLSQKSIDLPLSKQNLISLHLQIPECYGLLQSPFTFPCRQLQNHLDHKMKEKSGNNRSVSEILGNSSLRQIQPKGPFLISIPLFFHCGRRGKSINKNHNLTLDRPMLFQLSESRISFSLGSRLLWTWRYLDESTVLLTRKSAMVFRWPFHQFSRAICSVELWNGFLGIHN